MSRANIAYCVCPVSGWCRGGTGLSNLVDVRISWSGYLSYQKEYSITYCDNNRLPMVMCYSVATFVLF